MPVPRLPLGGASSLVRSSRTAVVDSLQPFGEALDRFARRDETVDRIGRVGVAERHAADDHLIVRQPDLVLDDAMELRERRLRQVTATGVQDSLWFASGS